jgi:hypothetical protein
MCKFFARHVLLKYISALVFSSLIFVFMNLYMLLAWLACICRKIPGCTSIGHYGSNESFVEGQFNVSALSLRFECSEGLGFDHFYVQFPCNLPIENYIEIFCTIYKWNVSSVQYEVRLRRSTTTREVEPPSLILIYFNIPALTPSLHWAETSLEFSNNEALLAVCRI